ncbi:YitT family protein [Phaeobacter sp. J2-8]|uniref:YitT family protein n=1 Tax=Phaeobacter sp. J2-8 TaxID=2931394 RepID=UPI001FD2B0C4|nr:YitT family protein [Phaeobacter sp. J2-8]MCJ7871655.1 YitT family protein [Phaeobacter sp. J2-8]
MKFRLSAFDIQGLAFGIVMISLGVLFLKSAGLVTGQTAGIALLLSYLLPLDFGPLFFLIGVPFLVLAWVKRGPVFALRTIIVVVGVSIVSDVFGRFVLFERLDAPLAALLGGASSGIGLVAVFRHNASAGGMTILGIILEQKTGFKAGWFQLSVDAFVFLASAFVLSPSQLAYSFLGALITNFAVIWNFDVAQSATGRPGYGRPANSPPPLQ